MNNQEFKAKLEAKTGTDIQVVIDNLSKIQGLFLRFDHKIELKGYTNDFDNLSNLLDLLREIRDEED